MDAFDHSELVNRQHASGNRYLEFLRVPAMSAGLYHLPVGSSDAQQPHTEDELYIVMAGQAFIRVDGEDRRVSTGSVVFVGARVPHTFHTITESLDVLVVFAPAEYSQR